MCNNTTLSETNRASHDHDHERVEANAVLFGRLNQIAVKGARNPGNKLSAVIIYQPQLGNSLSSNMQPATSNRWIITVTPFSSHNISGPIGK